LWWTEDEANNRACGIVRVATYEPRLKDVLTLKADAALTMVALVGWDRDSRSWHILIEIVPAGQLSGEDRVVSAILTCLSKWVIRRVVGTAASAGGFQWRRDRAYSLHEKELEDALTVFQRLN
jgi:hypothetical protein